jgi:predicted transcriptional regulator
MAVACKRATVYLEPELHEALQRKAVATDRTISDLIKEAVREDLEEEAEDLAAIRDRAGERGIPFEEVVQDLRRRGKI